MSARTAATEVCSRHQRQLSHAEALARRCSWCDPEAFRSLDPRDMAKGKIEPMAPPPDLWEVSPDDLPEDDDT